MDDIEMVFVEGGTFMMGGTGDGCWRIEKPAHSVTLGDFYIGKYVVTQKQWVAVMGDNPSDFKGDDLPVESVSWDDVQEFISRLNQLTGKEYRLPTEAEWEYAARGGNKGKGYKYSGSNNINAVAWYYGNSGDNVLDDGSWNEDTLESNNNHQHPIGTKAPNELGVYDMSGNVWEWVSDWYGDYTEEAETNPQGPESGSSRVLRGGSLGNVAGACRVSYRNDDTPDVRGCGIGFRLALVSI